MFYLIRDLADFIEVFVIIARKCGIWACNYSYAMLAMLSLTVDLPNITNQANEFIGS